MFKNSTGFALMLFFAGTSLLADDALPGPSNSNFKSSKEKISYALGMDIGKSVSGNNLDIDIDFLVRGMRDAIGDGKPLLNDEELRATLVAFQEEIQKKALQEQQAMAEKNRKEGEAFLAQNKVKPGVMTLANGLQYKIIRRGTGPIPKATDKVRTHYKGTLVDGTVFDSSYERGEPVEFAVAGVIRGWTDALQRMPVGSKWTLYIPAQMAYGANGSGPIGPHATLIFEIELLGIVK